MAKYLLSDRGRRALDTLYAAITQINAPSRGVHSSFALDPTAEQRIEDLQREQVAFLQRINVIGVRDMIGQVIGLGTEDMIASRTAEADLPRKPKYIGQLEDREYRLWDTEFDTKLPWQIIDAWSKFPDFAQRYSRHVAISVALSRIAVGWHGITAAASTNPEDNPNGEDVNIGWL
ncbi:MAG: P2 family phage major capsid protein, partial [Pseudomonadota bacterium]|nr:P2 family phage major capsid protein [Pseudomonadota bacterium]